MQILYGLIRAMDISMRFMFIFLPCALAVLVLLYFIFRHLEKKKKDMMKIWSALCFIPLLVYLVFMINVYYAGNVELTINRYAAFGVVALITALWGLLVCSKRRFAVKTIITSILSIVILLSHVIAIWAVWLRPNVTNGSHMGWTESFECAIDTLERGYVLNEWKEIDYAKIREELIPKVQKAEAENDELAYVYALYELKYEFGDGHVTVRGDMETRDAAIARYAGNDYGFSMFRTDGGDIIAVMVDENSECFSKGIHDGTVITSWNGVPVEEALTGVKCIDRIYSIQTIENIEIVQPVFLAGLGGDVLDVGFINDDSEEENVQIRSCGDYINRRSEMLRILFGENVVSHDNYSVSLIDGHIGYLRITEEEYSTDPLFIARCTIAGYSKEIHDDINARLQELREEGMDGIIIDLRNNDGGNGFEARTVASLFTRNPVPYYLSLYVDGECRIISKADDIGNHGEWSDMPVTVLVNGQTKSAGETMTYYLKGSDNVTITGNTGTWGNAQGTGGSVILSGGRYEIRFPITPNLGDDHQPIVDTRADRVSRLQLDCRIEYSADEAVEFFASPERDMVLEKAVDC